MFAFIVVFVIRPFLIVNVGSTTFPVPLGRSSTSALELYELIVFVLNSNVDVLSPCAVIPVLLMLVLCVPFV